MSSKLQLFCFTFAGGTGDFFDVIKDDLDNIDVVKLEYAGHGKRYKEEFYKDFEELADDLFEKILESYNGGDYALFGYSMGSISAVEVLKRVFASDMKRPRYIFLAAHEPQTKYELRGFDSDELDEWVKQRTIWFGGVPEKLLNNKAFWRTYLPIYRADYSLIAGYRFESLELKTDIPAVIFYSETDTHESDMKLWEQYFPCEFHEFSGTHFFINEHHKEMADIIRRRMGAENDL